MNIVDIIEKEVKEKINEYKTISEDHMIFGMNTSNMFTLKAKN